MGVSCEGPSCDDEVDQSVLANTKTLDSVLKKNSSSLVCHLIREGADMDDWKTSCGNYHEN